MTIYSAEIKTRRDLYNDGERTKWKNVIEYDATRLLMGKRASPEIIGNRTRWLGWREMAEVTRRTVNWWPK